LCVREPRPRGGDKRCKACTKDYALHIRRPVTLVSHHVGGWRSPAELSPSYGLLANDEAELTRAFMAFAGRAGSHAGISDQVDAQLRRHFATALTSFGIAKLG
jgi:hypothetical protein